MSVSGTTVPVSPAHHFDASVVDADNTKDRTACIGSPAHIQHTHTRAHSQLSLDIKDIEACRPIAPALGSPFHFDKKKSPFPIPTRDDWTPERRSTLRHRARLCCTLAVGVGSLMIGTIVALVLFIYALNIDRLWMNELARGGSGLGAWDPATGHGEAGVVKRRWLHSHNDEMRGKDALTLALDLGYGSIEIDTWLGEAPAASSAVKTSHEKRSGLVVRPLADLFQPSVYDDSFFFLPMERRRPKDESSAHTPASDSALGMLRDDGVSLLPLEPRAIVDEEIDQTGLDDEVSEPKRKSALAYLFEPIYDLLPLERRRVPDDADTVASPTPTPNPALTLLTGHKVKDVSDHTLAGLYFEPLLARLDKNNADRQANESVVGLYADDPDAEVQIVIDMKSDGDAMWPYILDALKPFQDRGYLTTFDTSTSTWFRSALIIVGTGNTPLHHVYHSRVRTVFYDAPLMALAKPASVPASAAGPAATFEWDNTIAPMASAKFPLLYHLVLGMPPYNPVVQQLLWYTGEARSRAISSRWWGAARIPEWTRRCLWVVMKQGGATWTGADDLVDAQAWLNAWEAR